MLKERILELLEENIGKRITGGEFARTLNVSRTAVWKAIRTLKENGEDITTFPNGGYVLNSLGDNLSVNYIEDLLTTEYIGRNITLLSAVDSTNTYLKKHINAGTAEGNVIISNSQTAGKGRINRSFFSPSGKGIFLSILLKPQIPPSEINLITIIAALAVCQSILEVCSVNCDIKWVNDILYEGKKLCGILTEASFEGESGQVQYVICGIGIKVDIPKNEFPEDVRPLATSIRSITNTVFTRNHLIAAVLNNFEKLYKSLQKGEKSSIINEYRSKLFMLGKNIRVISGDNSYEAVAVDIDKDAHLIVETPSGERRCLNSGEISIRPS